MSHGDAQWPTPTSISRWPKRSWASSCTRPTLFPCLVLQIVPSWLTEQLKRASTLPFVSEKARSELVISPILLAVREMSDDKIAVLSGIRFDVGELLGVFKLILEQTANRSLPGNAPRPPQSRPASRSRRERKAPRLCRGPLQRRKSSCARRPGRSRGPSASIGKGPLGYDAVEHMVL